MIALKSCQCAPCAASNELPATATSAAHLSAAAGAALTCRAGGLAARELNNGEHDVHYSTILLSSTMAHNALSCSPEAAEVIFKFSTPTDDLGPPYIGVPVSALYVQTVLNLDSWADALIPERMG